MSSSGNVPSKKYQLMHWVNSYGSLPDSWKFLRLGDFFTERKEFSDDQRIFPLYSFTIEKGVTPKTERYERSFLLKNAEDNQYKVIRENNLIFNPMNIRFGAIDIYFGNTSVSVSAYYTIAESSGQKIDLRFMREYLRSPYMMDVYHRFAIGSLIEKRRIHWSMFQNTYVALPPVEEQKSIASVLSCWDRAIETTQKLIENTELQKRALMRQVFCSALSENWPEITLGSLGEFRKGSGISRSDCTDSGIPCIRYGEIYIHHHDVVHSFSSYISPEVAAASTKILPGDLLFTASGETAEEIGKCVAFTREEEAYAGGDIVLFSPKDINPAFLAYQLNSSLLVRQKMRYAQGQSVVHISATNLAKLKLRLPERPIQNRIASILLNFDRYTTDLRQEKQLLVYEKSALMQQLLTGKRRVKVDSDVDRIVEEVSAHG